MKFLILLLSISLLHAASAYAGPATFDEAIEQYTIPAYDNAKRRMNSFSAEQSMSAAKNEVTKDNPKALNPYDGGAPPIISFLSHVLDFSGVIAPELFEPLGIVSLAQPYPPGLSTGQCTEYTASSNLCMRTYVRCSGLFGTCCRVCFETTFSLDYNYPVDKVEIHQTPFTTRYIPKTMVGFYKAAVESVDNSTEVRTTAASDRFAKSSVALSAALSRQGGSSVRIKMAPTLEEIKKSIDSAKGIGNGTTLRSNNRSEEHFIEYHAMPEVFSRQAYEIIRSTGKVTLLVLRICVGCGGGVSVVPVNFPQLCHDNLPPTQADDFSIDEHFIGSEFPELGQSNPIGAFMITRDPYSIETNTKLSSLRAEYRRIMEDPFMCSKVNLGSSGISPKELGDEMKLPERDLIRPCLRNNLGSYLPLTNYVASSYDATAAPIGFYRGKLLQEIFKPNVSYKFDIDKDLVQWISQSQKMPQGCNSLEAFNFLEMGEGLFEEPHDMPITGVEWRNFHCCHRGWRPMGWSQRKR